MVAVLFYKLWNLETSRWSLQTQMHSTVYVKVFFYYIVYCDVVYIQSFITQKASSINYYFK